MFACTHLKIHWSLLIRCTPLYAYKRLSGIKVPSIKSFFWVCVPLFINIQINKLKDKSPLILRVSLENNFLSHPTHARDYPEGQQTRVLLDQRGVNIVQQVVLGIRHFLHALVFQGIFRDLQQAVIVCIPLAFITYSLCGSSQHI